MPREGLKVEDGRRAGPGKARDKNQDRLPATGQRIYDGCEEIRESTEVVLKLIREREVNLRQRLPEIKAL